MVSRLLCFFSIFFLCGPTQNVISIPLGLTSVTDCYYHFVHSKGTRRTRPTSSSVTMSRDQRVVAPSASTFSPTSLGLSISVPSQRTIPTTRLVYQYFYNGPTTNTHPSQRTMERHLPSMVRPTIPSD